MIFGSLKGKLEMTPHVVWEGVADEVGDLN